MRIRGADVSEMELEKQIVFHKLFRFSAGKAVKIFVHPHHQLVFLFQLRVQPFIRRLVTQKFGDKRKKLVRIGLHFGERFAAVIRGL